jgi:N-acyl-D-amino-acid deacylase
LAVARQGKLVYARGFGYANVSNQVPVRPRSLFRIASVSKTITSAAIFRLLERQQLRLDARVFELLNVHVRGRRVPAHDPRLRHVTVHHLLQHRGGWDNHASFDPMFRPVEIARAFGAPPPAGPDLILPYMWRRPLDFDPGTRQVYSNFGYCVLGRVIEKVTGRPYEQFVQADLLEPLGIRAMRIGRTLLREKAPGEVHYYAHDRPVPAVLGPNLGKPVPPPYGGEYIEAMDSHGGWIASAVDLVRFASALYPESPDRLLNEESLRIMLARPEIPQGLNRSGKAGVEDKEEKPERNYYACGWGVMLVGPDGRRNTSHGGFLYGAMSLLFRRHDGVCWAVLFNSDFVHGESAPDGKIERPVDAIEPLLVKAIRAIQEWPQIDLFERFGVVES